MIPSNDRNIPKRLAHCQAFSKVLSASIMKLDRHAVETEDESIAFLLVQLCSRFGDSDQPIVVRSYYNTTFEELSPDGFPGSCSESRIAVLKEGGIALHVAFWPNAVPTVKDLCKADCRMHGVLFSRKRLQRVFRCSIRIEEGSDVNSFSKWLKLAGFKFLDEAH